MQDGCGDADVQNVDLAVAVRILARFGRTAIMQAQMSIELDYLPAVPATNGFIEAATVLGTDKNRLNAAHAESR